MAFRITTRVRILIGFVVAVLTGCSQVPNYAPVKTANQVLAPKNGNEDNRTRVSGEAQSTQEQKMVSPTPSKQGVFSANQPSRQTKSPVTAKQQAKVNPAHAAAASQQKKSPPIFPEEKKSQTMQKSVSTPEKNEKKYVNQSAKDDESGSSLVLKQQPPKISETNLFKQGKNNATISNPAMLSSRKSPVDDEKKQKKLLISSKKLEEETSVISNDNKKMLKLNFGWPLQGKVSRNFAQTDHKGIDIAGKNGQTVRASESGKAVYCGQGLKGFGNLAIIKHNETYLSAYANNSKLYIAEGQRVKKGQTIGQVGITGLKKTSLHFEIRKNGQPIDPLSLLPAH